MRKSILSILLIVIILGISVQAQTDENSCSVVLEDRVEVVTYLDNQNLTLPVGTLIEFVGQEPDGSAWILRQNDQYLLYSSSASDLRPVACAPSSWGPPPREYLPLQTVMDEVGITAWHEQGYFGQGVRVGILDTRYDDLSTTLTELPISQSQVKFIPSLSELETLLPKAERTETHHGTNVFEVMAYIAPKAEYVLARSVDAASFTQAVDDLIAENVQIIVHASNVITSDPTPYHDAVRRADAAGILWINSAGNIGAGYYPARYSGDDLITNHQFDDPNRAGSQTSLMVPVDRNGSAQVTLVWNSQSDTAPNDYELIVYGSCNRRDETTFVALRADADQTSDAPTFESIPLSNGLLQQINDYTTIPTTDTSLDCPDEALPDGIVDNEIYVTVVDAVGNAVTDSRFDLYIEGALPAEFDPDIHTSLDPVVLVPGDIAESFTVGAYDWRNNKIAWYSGRSNSLQYYELNNYDVDYSDDEVVKPDIVTYGDLRLPSGRAFFGTSAATPVIGGVISLIIANNETTNSDRVREFIASSAVQCLQDSIIGHQVLYLKSLLLEDGAKNNCAPHAWSPDISSSLITSFVQPEIIVRDVQIQKLSEVIVARNMALEAVRILDQQSVNYVTALNLAIYSLARAYTPEADEAMVRAVRVVSEQNPLRGLGIDLESWPAINRGASPISFSPDSSILLVGGSNLELFPMDNTQRHRQLGLSTQHYSLSSVAFSPDGSRIVAGGERDGKIDLWGISGNRPMRTFDGTDGRSVSQMIFLPNDRDKLISSSTDGSIIVWDVETGNVETLIENNYGPFGGSMRVFRIAVSPDSTYIASGDGFGIVRVWNIANGDLVGEYENMDILAKTNSRVVAGLDWVSNDELIYTLDTGEVIRQMISGQAHLITVLRGVILDSKLLPGGETIAINVCEQGEGGFICTSNKLMILDLQVNELIRSIPLTTPSNPTYFPSITISQDGSLVAVSGYDIEIWHTNIWDDIAFACGRVLGDLTDGERSRYAITEEHPCSELGESQN